MSSKHTLPANPSWLEFERSDGDSFNWPTNTTREVDHEGHVNYMRICAIDEPLCIKWRVEVGKALAEHLELQRESCYISGLITPNVVDSWPRLCFEGMAGRLPNVRP